jgi:hypothetical protein
MNKLLFLFAATISLTACATDSALTQPERDLLWVQDANPQVDAQKALEKYDFRMMAMPQRATIIPGVPVEQMREYEIKCGVNLINGVSDMVLNENHLQLMKQAHKYALQYNAIIKRHCKP